MLFQISGDRTNHPSAKLTPDNYEACQDAMYSGTAYLGGFDASKFNPDDFHFVDMIESYGFPVFNNRFVEFCLEEGLKGVIFHSVTIKWGKENLLDHLNGKVTGFFTASIPAVRVIDDSITPMLYWPMLKKFKNYDYVITSDLPDNVKIGIDLKRPNIVICSSDLQQRLVERKMKVSCFELPTLIPGPSS